MGERGPATDQGADFRVRSGLYPDQAGPEDPQVPAPAERGSQEHPGLAPRQAVSAQRYQHNDGHRSLHQRVQEEERSRSVHGRGVIGNYRVDAPLNETLSIVASIRQPYRCDRNEN